MNFFPFAESANHTNLSLSGILPLRQLLPSGVIDKESAASSNNDSITNQQIKLISFDTANEQPKLHFLKTS